MKSKSEMKCLYFGVKTSIFIRNNPNFCNRTGKVLKIYSFYLSFFKFDAALFNLHISCRVLFIKPAKIFAYFASKTDIFIFRYIWEMHVLLFHRYRGIVIL